MTELAIGFLLGVTASLTHHAVLYLRATAFMAGRVGLGVQLLLFILGLTVPVALLLCSLRLSNGAFYVAALTWPGTHGALVWLERARFSGSLVDLREDHEG